MMVTHGTRDSEKQCLLMRFNCSLYPYGVSLRALLYTVERELKPRVTFWYNNIGQIIVNNKRENGLKIKISVKSILLVYRSDHVRQIISLLCDTTTARCWSLVAIYIFLPCYGSKQNYSFSVDSTLAGAALVLKRNMETSSVKKCGNCIVKSMKFCTAQLICWRKLIYPSQKHHHAKLIFLGAVSIVLQLDFHVKQICLTQNDTIK